MGKRNVGGSIDSAEAGGAVWLARQELTGGIDATVRYFWEGTFRAGKVELRRRIYDCEMVYVSSGTAELDLAGHKNVLRPGSLVIIPPALLHQTFVPLDAEVVRHCIHFDWMAGQGHREAPLWCNHGDRFDPALVHAVPPSLASRLPVVRDISGERAVTETMEMLLRLLRVSDPFAPRLLAVVLRWLVDPPIAPDVATEAAAHAQHRMDFLLRFIDEHFAETLTHERLCEIAGMSSTSLCRWFNAMVGAKPMTHLNLVRIRNAQRLLCERSDPVSAIAAQVGFADANYFCRIFRRETGMSPGVFRQQNRNLREEQSRLLPNTGKRHEP